MTIYSKANLQKCCQTPPSHRFQPVLWCLLLQRHFGALNGKSSLNLNTTKKMANLQTAVERHTWQTHVTAWRPDVSESVWYQKNSRTKDCTFKYLRSSTEYTTRYAWKVWTTKLLVFLRYRNNGWIIPFKIPRLRWLVLRVSQTG